MTYGQENRAFATKLGVPPGMLAEATIVIELPPSQYHRPAARAAFVFAANLLCRLFARVHLVAPDLPLGPNPWALASLRDVGTVLANLSEGIIEWNYPDFPDVVLGIGAPPSHHGRHDVFVGFTRGMAALDSIITGEEDDVLSALFSCCYGAAQVFLHIAAAHGAALEPIAPFTFALSPYSLCEDLDLGDLHLAGVGAVGCAFLYGLGHLSSCRGTIYLVDDDIVDDTNLHRYVLMKRDDVNKAKVEVGAAALRFGQIISKPFAGTYDAFLAAAPSRAVDLLLTPIDSEAGRRHLAASLPRLIVNASTGDRYITVSRHGFADGLACLHCLFLPSGGPPTTEQRIAQELGVGVGEVERLLAENAPISADFVRRAEAHRGAAPGAFAQWIGKRVQSFHQRAICGSAAIPTANGSIVAPLSFISAAAGLLLAAEVIGLRSLPDQGTRPNYLRMDALGSPAQALQERRTPDSTRRCICDDPDYVDVYRTRYDTLSSARETRTDDPDPRAGANTQSTETAFDCRS